MNSAGQLYAWGGNGTGELGIGTYDSASHPQPTQLLTTKKIARVAAHYESSLALTADEAAVTAGATTARARAGVKDTKGLSVNTPTAVAIPSGSRWVALGISNDRAAAIRSDGTLWGWGKLPRPCPSFKPVQILTGTTADQNWVTIGVGGGATILAIKANGQMYKVTGTKATLDRDRGLRANLLAVTHAGTLVSVAGGSVYSWGDCSLGQLGNGLEFDNIDSASPVLSYYFNPRALVAGGAFSWEIVGNGGGRQIAGDNDLGELGPRLRRLRHARPDHHQQRVRLLSRGP